MMNIKKKKKNEVVLQNKILYGSMDENIDNLSVESATKK